MTTRKRTPKARRDCFKASRKAVLRYDEQTKMHIAYAPGLHIYAQAATPDRAKRTFEGALTLLLTAAQKNRALASMLP